MFLLEYSMATTEIDYLKLLVGVRWNIMIQNGEIEMFTILG